MDSYNWTSLSEKLTGEVATDRATRLQYATDASIYRVVPLGVALPKNDADVVEIVRFAGENQIPLIPRTAGTSLAGQVVGKGLVVDFSKMNAIIELDVDKKWVRVQPGVIRDELNHQLFRHGLFFSPNTSTSNRCMIGGMVGNNSCGTTSIKYGSTRDKILEVDAVLSTGERAVFRAVEGSGPEAAKASAGREGAIYRGVLEMLSEPGVAKSVSEGFPRPDILRRNSGYALDALLEMQPFRADGAALNLAKLIAGSEGTLCIITSVKVALDPLPPPHVMAVCAHFHSLGDALRATVVAMRHSLFACELMDGTILELTKHNPEQQENRFFVSGDPEAILCMELRAGSQTEVQALADELIADLRANGLGHYYPKVKGADEEKVWSLRAAGLGVLSNMDGDAKPVAFVEDTAVSLEDLPDYIADFEKLMARHQKQVVYYAHAGAGELHLRPVLNLKSVDDRKLLREIARDSAELVSKYRGSLSGEHGDGRVRAEFLPAMVGDANYQLFRRLKTLWDPDGIFNPGKIVDPEPMDTDLRYDAGQAPFAFQTFLDFSEDGNMQGAAERCNGSGDCRKPAFTGASMCPSYQASGAEKDSTRARANILREAMTRPLDSENPLSDPAARDVLDLCLSCKACKRECPSNVDMALLKAETLFQRAETHGYTRSEKFFGNFAKTAERAVPFAKLANRMMDAKPFSGWFKKRFGIAPARSMPKFSTRRASRLVAPYCTAGGKDFLLYLDEFTEFQDASVAEAAAQFFHRLGYRFQAVYAPSGRPPMSKGMLREAAGAVRHLIDVTSEAVEAGMPIVGLEPSALLGMRDDLPKLLRGEARSHADAMGNLALTFEEFVAREIALKRIAREDFDDRVRTIHLHTHCHQKSLSHVKFGFEILSYPSGHRVVKIPSGCCGMAGSFGYETGHHAMSMKIGELVLFPRIRNLKSGEIAVTSGTSCRHQILDGTGVETRHPAQVMLEALRR